MRTEPEPSRSPPLARALIILMILLAFDVPATTVWTWVDEKGVKHYSQSPIPGATRVDIGPSNRAAPYIPRSASNPPAGQQHRAGQPAAVEAKYAELAIVQPKDDETLWNIGGGVRGELRLDPALRPGHQLILKLDDRRIEGLAAGATNFELKDVAPGTHLLVAAIHDENRQALQEAAVTFHVRQTLIKKPVQPLPNRP